jgi:hypothetical protein
VTGCFVSPRLSPKKRRKVIFFLLRGLDMIWSVQIYHHTLPFGYRSGKPDGFKCPVVGLFVCTDSQFFPR